jgi:DNA polymerase-3 subunit alpha
LIKDSLLVVEGQVSRDDFNDNIKIRADTVCGLDDARQRQLRSITVAWSHGRLPPEPHRQLEQLLDTYRNNRRSEPGHCRIYIDYVGADARATLELGPLWSVQPTTEFIHQLRHLFGRNSLRLDYSQH